MNGSNTCTNLWYLAEVTVVFGCTPASTWCCNRIVVSQCSWPRPGSHIRFQSGSLPRYPEPFVTLQKLCWLSISKIWYHNCNRHCVSIQAQIWDRVALTQLHSFGTTIISASLEKWPYASCISQRRCLWAGNPYHIWYLALWSLMDLCVDADSIISMLYDDKKLHKILWDVGELEIWCLGPVLKDMVRYGTSESWKNDASC